MSRRNVNGNIVQRKKTHANTNVGIESLLDQGIRTILVKGNPGGGKTLLSLELLKCHGRGVYFSSRVSEEGIFDQYPDLKTLLKTGEIRVARPKMPKAKFADIRLADAVTVMSSILESISKMKEPLLILDSWDTVARELESVERMKTEKALVTIADGRKARIVFISEDPNLSSTDYAVDAVVTLKDDLYEGRRRVRRIEWNKLRGADISQKSYLFSLYGARFNLCRPMERNLPEGYKAREFVHTENSERFYSTGSADLDAFLGGGIRKGERILVELGQYLGGEWHLPLMNSISFNFVLNGGCNIVIPTSGLVPETVKELRSRHLPRQTIENVVKVGHFGEAGSEDSCFFKLDPSSITKTFELFYKEVETIRTRLGDNSGKRRPCLLEVGVDRLEAIFGHEILGQYFQRGAATTRQEGDAGILIAKHSTKSNESLADLCDTHLKFDEIDGALVIYSMKPPSRICHVQYDYILGYPRVRLTPIA